MQAIKTGTIPWVRMSPFYTRPSKIASDSTVSLLDVMQRMAKDKGILGFYPNYRATLMRNIPSAVVRCIRVHCHSQITSAKMYTYKQISIQMLAYIKN
jgi:hypothetical protein